MERDAIALHPAGTHTFANGPQLGDSRQGALVQRVDAGSSSWPTGFDGPPAGGY
jgi:hypothetical protein